MTAEAKQLLNSLFQKHDPDNDYTDNEIPERDLKVISEFTLQIAEKAVGGVRKETREGGEATENLAVIVALENALSRIKSELNSSGVNENINTTKTGGE